MSIDPTMISILAPAFIAGAIISLAHIPLGTEVLKRGIIFLDLAVAQFAALGMTAFHVFFENHDTDPRYAVMGSLVFGLGMALTCALGLHLLEKRTGRYHEALIGCSFVCAASLSILFTAGDPHSGEEMKDILAGQILWITWGDLMLYSPVFLSVAALWTLLEAHRARLFYILFALTIPFSVNLIGIYLVFASLILPALATAQTEQYKQFKAYMISLISFLVGLIVSYFWDTPSGPTIVITMLVLSLLFSRLLMLKPSQNKTGP